MGDRSAAVTLVPKGYEQQPSIDQEMEAFMQQVQQVQTLADIASMNGSDHIARLHRPGAKYFNMCVATCTARARAERASRATRPPHRRYRSRDTGTRSRCSA